MLIVLAVAAALSVALAGWAWMQARAPLRVEGRGQMLLPGLQRRLADVARIEITRGDETLVLKRKGDGWVAGEAEWPVVPQQVKSVLVTLAEMKKVQPATALPKHYRAIFVDAPNRDSLSARVVLKDDRGKVLADVILGKEAFDWLGGGREAQFARIPSEKRAWLVEGRVRATPVITAWIDNRLLSLPVDGIAEVVIRHPGEEPLRLVANREQAGDGENAPKVPDIPLKLVNAPAGAKPNGTGIRQLFYSLVDLTFEDVRKARDGVKPLATAEVRTTKGLRVAFDVWKEGKHWWLRGRVLADGADTKQAGALRGRLRGRAFRVFDSVGEALSSGLADLIEARAVDLTGPAKDGETDAAPSSAPAPANKAAPGTP
jgi:hypothetical protein